VTLWTVIGALIAGYLLLLARSAWKQGELMQFLRALVIVAVLLLAVGGIVALWIWVDRHG